VVADDGVRLDVSACAPEFDAAFLGGDGLSRLARWLAEHGAAAPRVDPAARWGPPIASPSKIVCAGLNYRDHAAETNAAIPSEPVLFLKAPSSLAGPNDPVVIPRGAEKLDWEVELAVIIGKTARYVAEEHAMECVAGYALHNDYSERGFQLERGGQWTKGKSADSFAPLGPFLATRDEVPDPGRLDMWLTVNGEPRQRSNTGNMIFGVATLVSYISRFMTLLPGDIISTGTPAGVGLGMRPPRYLEAGDVVALGIEGLGTSSQRVVAEGG
jgi:2,4-diketo-3-deoxy-L-fuconate hydrolase